MYKKAISTSTFTFENLIERNGLYVDKTQYFYKLVTSLQNCYFCSRPRRFGKSLAISTLKNIFLGHKELFKGLYIYDTDYDWQVYPVIHIDMAQSDSSSVETLIDSLYCKLKNVANFYDVAVDGSSPAIFFNELVIALREKTGKKVVILIDEYDRPLTENLDNIENLERVRKVLDSFYQIIKGQEPNEQFVFMTGVTKFSKVSIFSKLNNLTDISMHKDYACMFGYTQEELEKNFALYIDEYAQENNLDKNEFLAEIKTWYNGFKFDYESETVYNPVSIGQFFNNSCRFDNYWFTTATPTFITKLAKKQMLTKEDVYEARMSLSELNVFDIAELAKENISKEILIQLLFQTGYLTIDSKMEVVRNCFFRLKFPNFEVQDSFENILFEIYSGMERVRGLSYVANIVDAAENAKIDRMMELFQNFLSEVPYNIQIKKEKYYQTVIFCILRMSGMNLEAENATNKGRIDAVLETQRYFYIFEFKIDSTSEIALEQIMQKEYFQKFIEKANSSGKKIYCIGMNFSTEQKNITDWKVE